jgi:hypothetical protein
MGSSGGGVWLPGDPPPLASGATWSFSGATIQGGTITGATISGGTQASTGSTFTTPTIVGATISGTVTIATGATITNPTMLITTASVTATGTGSADAAALTAVTPQYVGITGATGSGVALPTGPAGLCYALGNLAAATMRVYCSGGTINGTTGTTAFTITNTGNKLAWAFNTSATGAWQIQGNT